MDGLPPQTSPRHFELDPLPEPRLDEARGHRRDRIELRRARVDRREEDADHGQAVPGALTNHERVPSRGVHPMHRSRIVAAPVFTDTENIAAAPAGPLGTVSAMPRRREHRQRQWQTPRHRPNDERSGNADGAPRRHQAERPVAADARRGARLQAPRHHRYGGLHSGRGAVEPSPADAAPLGPVQKVAPVAAEIPAGQPPEGRADANPLSDPTAFPVERHTAPDRGDQQPRAHDPDEERRRATRPHRPSPARAGDR